MRRILIAGLFALFIWGCSPAEDAFGVPVPEPPAPVPAIAIGLGVSGPASVSPGSTAQVTVTVARLIDFNGLVTLSTEGLPPGVSATFLPPVAPNLTSTTSTLVLSAGLAAMPGVVTAQVRATATGVPDASVGLLIHVNP